MWPRQTTLHWAIIQGDWDKTLRLLHKNEDHAKIADRGGNYPIHLAAYNDYGHAPPSIIRELIKACPQALVEKNKAGYTPLQLARLNYRHDDPNRAPILDMLALEVTRQSRSKTSAGTHVSTTSMSLLKQSAGHGARVTPCVH
jgi:hypothetical protein